MYKYVIGSLSLSFFFSGLFGQTLPNIQTDRPSETESPYIVPKKHLQVESGFNFERVNHDSTAWLYPSTVWRLGVNENVELRLITELTTEKYKLNKASGFNPVMVGIKVKLAKEKGLLPLTSFIGHISIPGLAGKDLKETFPAPEFRFAMQHTLSKKFKLNYNLGAEWNGEDGEPTFVYTISTNYSISDKLNSFVEFYGFAPQKETADHRFDAGLSMLLKSNLQIDLSGGVGITRNAPDYYTSLGVSFRLKD
jgi:outer membrane putative beta-barrel porin/alpha-amylase